MTYIHRKTGIKIKAVKYRQGNKMEDGFLKDENGNERPWKKVSNASGFWKNKFITESDYLIQHKNYLFMMNKNDFKKIYKRGD